MKAENDFQTISCEECQGEMNRRTTGYCHHLLHLCSLEYPAKWTWPLNAHCRSAGWSALKDNSLSQNSKQSCSIQYTFIYIATLTKMPPTRAISKTVGPRLKTRALRTKEMPLVPRSIALDSAPVWRLRWNPRSRLCRCRKTFLAMRRMELWATLPNTVFLSSLKNAAQARETPSEEQRRRGSLRTPAVKSREV